MIKKVIMRYRLIAFTANVDQIFTFSSISLKEYILCLVAAMILYSPKVNSQSYQDIFPLSFEQALEFTEKIRPDLENIALQYNLSGNQLLPIIFPECARFSLIQDIIETTGLELLYVNFGEAYADFSIGHFQMKPSFIEELEAFVSKNSSMHAFLFIVEYPNTSLKEIRSIRLQRLSNLKWQMKYLCCVFKALEIIHRKKEFVDEKSKLLFYATAYNCGFLSKAEDVNKWMDKKYFPYGALNYYSFTYHQVVLEYLNYLK